MSEQDIPDGYPGDVVDSHKADDAADDSFYIGVLVGAIAMLIVEVVFGLAAWGIWTWIH